MRPCPNSSGNKSNGRSAHTKMPRREVTEAGRRPGLPIILFLLLGDFASLREIQAVPTEPLTFFDDDCSSLLLSRQKLCDDARAVRSFLFQSPQFRKSSTKDQKTDEK